MKDRSIAYFSMEVALAPEIPTYSGGLGALAGDTIRSAADLGVPMVAVTLLHRKGYLYQRLDSTGTQKEEPVEWVVEDFLEALPPRVTVEIAKRPVVLRAWKYVVSGLGGYTVPVVLLDADLPENDPWDRTLTDFLYGGDPRYRLGQEIVLGIGGVRLLRALGCTGLERFHMNEGHAALLTLELLEEAAGKAGRTACTREDVRAVRQQCVFTTHTPVPAGHDQFPMEIVDSVLGARPCFGDMPEAFFLRATEPGADVPAAADTGPAHASPVPPHQATLNMTFLALSLSGYVNGVARRHGEVSRLMFAGYRIESITNGVHAATWVAPPFQTLFDRHMPTWREDNFTLRGALAISRNDLWAAHMEAKRRLLHYVNREANAGFHHDVLTIGFARRATAYKRADLLLTDLERLMRLGIERGALQILYAGKAHPRDQSGKDLIRRIFAMRDRLAGSIRLVYLENYDLELAKLMTAGVDVWLNTPQRPLEASGTSGMKAALNGVPSLSILDGWWIEGHIEGVTGWSIGEDGPAGQAPGDAEDARALYEKLEKAVVPTFYGNRPRFIDIMRHAIALNGSFFNTQRMMQQYVLKAYSRWFTATLTRR